MAKTENKPQWIRLTFAQIKVRLALSFITLVVATLFVMELLGLMGIPFSNYPGRIALQKTEAFRSLSQIADLKKERFLLWLQERRNDACVIAESKLVAENISRLQNRIYDLASSNNDEGDIWARVRQEPLLKKLTNSLLHTWDKHGMYQKIQIADIKTNKIILSTNDSDVGAEGESFVPFSKALLSFDEIVSDVDIHFDKTADFHIFRAIRDETGSAIAILIMHINFNDFIHPMLRAGSGLGNSVQTLLVNQSSQIITSLAGTLPDGKIAEPLKYKARHIAAVYAARGEEGIIQADDYRGASTLAAYRHIRVTPEFGWGLVVKRDTAEVLTSVHEDIINTVLIGLCGILSAIFLASIVAHKFTSPILSLAKTAEKVADGDLHARAMVKENDEVGVLAATFNSMIERIQDWTKELEKQIADRTADLKESEERYRSITECAPDGIFKTDKTGKYTYVNPVGCKMMGYTLEEMLEMNITDHVKPEDQNKIIEDFKLLIEKGALSKEYDLVKKDKSVIPVALTATKLGKEYMAFCKDITNSKKAEEEKKRLLSSLKQAQKMEAIGTLAGGIAHDFNNILTPIIGYTEYYLRKFSEDSKTSSDLKIVLNSGLRARDLVKQILTFSRQTEQELTSFHLSSAIKEALKLISSILPSTIEIRQNLDENSCAIKGNLTQIHQMMMNLCINAEHAMREKGGTLEIKLESVHLDTKFSAIHFRLKKGNYAKLTVSDTGHGMSEKIKERIFEPFFTTKGIGEGSGMGLSTVHGVVLSHGGDIMVNSELEKGTTFDIYLPTVEIGKTKEKPQPSAISRGNERILFVDDEEVIARGGKDMLGSLGYKVVAKTKSQEALETFKSDPNNFDLVITDQTMPNITGDVLAREILRIRPEIPVIICTGFSRAITAENAKAIGIRKIIMKPYVYSNVAQIIRKVLDQDKKMV